MKKITLLILTCFIGFTMNSQVSTSFESSEGWVEASLDMQNGWESNSATNTQINSINSTDGTMSLQLVPTTTFNGELIIGFSPLLTSTEDVVTVTVDMFIESSAGAVSTVEFATQVPSQGFLTTRVAFNADDTVGIVDDTDGMGTLGFIPAGTFTRDVWFEFEIEHRFAENVILYYIDGNLIFTGTVWAGTIIEQVLTLFNNLDSGAFYDNIRYSQDLLSVEESVFSNSISIFPNPTNDILNINFAKSLGTIAVDIINMNGQRVLTTSIDGFGNQSIATTELASGLYFAKITSKDASTTIKFIKN